MEKLDFYIDFNIEIPNIGKEFNLEAQQRLRELADGHSDLIGASVSLESIVKSESPYLYQVRIVLYKRPEDIAVVEKGSEPILTLRDGLDAIENSVRESRERLDQIVSRRAGMNDAVSQELSAQEVYATFFKDQDPAEILRKDRTEIASTLMVKEGLEQEAAYSAADQILQAAMERQNE